MRDRGHHWHHRLGMALHVIQAWLLHGHLPATPACGPLLTSCCNRSGQTLLTRDKCILPLHLY